MPQASRSRRARGAPLSAASGQRRPRRDACAQLNTKPRCCSESAIARFTNKSWVKAGSAISVAWDIDAGRTPNGVPRKSSLASASCLTFVDLANLEAMATPRMYNRTPYTATREICACGVGTQGSVGPVGVSSRWMRRQSSLQDAALSVSSRNAFGQTHDQALSQGAPDFDGLGFHLPNPAANGNGQAGLAGLSRLKTGSGLSTLHCDGSCATRQPRLT